MRYLKFRLVKFLAFLDYDKLRMDLIYIENYSIFLDIKLILTTIRIMFSKDSTEGIDKAQENAEKTERLIEEVKNKD